jgi:hypothetical protein
VCKSWKTNMHHGSKQHHCIFTKHVCRSLKTNMHHG